MLILVGVNSVLWTEFQHLMAWLIKPDLSMERRVLGIIKARSFLARLEECFLNSSKTQYGSLNLSIL